MASRFVVGEADVPVSRPILILGAPCSGTTWLGKIFDSHPNVLYRHEPDYRHPARPSVTGEALRAELANWISWRDLRTAGKRPFFRKSWQSAPAFVLRDMLSAALAAGACLPAVGSSFERARLPDFVAIDRARGLRPVLKSITWCHGAAAFAHALPESRTVLILRHPCGQVASVMRGARHRRFSLREAGTDMPYDEAQTMEFAGSRGVGNAAFQALPNAAKYAWSWLAFNEAALDALAGQPNACTVLYEDLCARPEPMTRELFAFAGLIWNPQTEAFLARSTSYTGRGGYYGVFQDTISVAERWRGTMVPEDQAAVRAVVQHSRLARLWPDLE